MSTAFKAPAKTFESSGRLSATLLLLLLLVVPLRSQLAVIPKAQVDLRGLPVLFEENVGQFPVEYDFVVRNAGGKLGIGPKGITFSRPSGSSVEALRIEWVNANPEASANGEEPLSATAFYLNMDAVPSGASLVARNFGRVYYQDLIPGVDLTYYGNGNRLEYDLTVSPGTTISSLRMRTTGADALELDAEGNLLIYQGGEFVLQRKPVVYQQSGSERSEVEARYVLLGEREAGFAVEDFDPDKPLVVDPIIEFATFFGSDKDLAFYDSTVDSAGNVVLIGTSDGGVLPGETVPPTVFPGTSRAQIFVSKISSDWTSVLFTSYISWAPPRTYDLEVAAAPDGSVYFSYVTMASLSSITASKPLIGTSLVSPDASGTQRTLLGKIAADGAALLWHTGLMCPGTLAMSELQADGLGRAVLAGNVSCSEYPSTPGAYTPPSGTSSSSSMIAVAAFEADGNGLAYSFRLGGTGGDLLRQLQIAPGNQPVIAGYTTRFDFPTSNDAFQRAIVGGSDVFVTRFTADGSAIAASTLFGGAGTDAATCLRVRDDGEILLGLETISDALPGTSGTFQPNRGSASDAIARISGDLRSVIWATYVPGISAVQDLASDTSGNLWMLALSEPSSIGPPITSTSILPYLNWSELHLSRFNSTGTIVTYGTHLPGNRSFGSISRFLAKPAATVPILGSYYRGDLPTPTTPETLTNWPEGSDRFGIYMLRVNMLDPTDCYYSISPEEQMASWRGGTVEFAVTAPAGCPWRIQSQYSGEAEIVPSHGFGSSAVGITISPSTTSYAERTRSFEFQNQHFYVRQEPAECTEPKLSPESLSFDSAGGVKSFSLSFPEGCSWSARASATWINTTVPQGILRSGSGTYTVSVSRNDFESRSGSIQIAGLSLPIVQPGGACTASISASTSAIPASGATSTISVTPSAASCAWSASASSRVQLGGSASATGTGTFTATVPANPTNIPLAETVFVAGKTLSLFQAAGECTAELQPNSTAFGSQGGGLYVQVNASGSACEWFTEIDGDWIVSSSTYTSGNGYFSAEIRPNKTGAARTGSVRILGRTITITQQGVTTVNVRVNGTLTGIPFRANGSYHQTPATLPVAPGAELQLLSDTEFVSPDHELWEFQSWNGVQSTARTIVVPEGGLDLSLEGKIYHGVRVAVEGNTPGDGSAVSISSTAPLHRTIGEWRFYSPRVPPDNDYGTVTLKATSGPSSYFLKWRESRQGNSNANPVTYTLGWPILAIAEFGSNSGPGPSLPGASASPASATIRVTAGVSQTVSAVVSIAKVGATEAVFASAEVLCSASPGIPFKVTTSRLTTPFTLTVSIDSSQIGNLATGSYTNCAARLLPATSGAAELVVPLTLVVDAAPTGDPRVEHPVDAAAYRAGTLAIGSIASIFGTNLSASADNVSALPLPTEFLGARLVLSREGSEQNCPLFYVSPTQINFQIPDSFPTGPAMLTFYRDGSRRNSAPITIGDVRPSLFTANSSGSGVPAGYFVTVRGSEQTKGDFFTCPSGGGSCVPTQIPAPPADGDVFLVLFGTGIRYRTVQPTVTINGVNAEIAYSGPQGQFVGLDQVNIKVPRTVFGSGVQALVLRVGSAQANAVQLQF